MRIIDSFKHLTVPPKYQDAKATVDAKVHCGREGALRGGPLRNPDLAEFRTEGGMSKYLQRLLPSQAQVTSLSHFTVSSAPFYKKGN